MADFGCLVAGDNSLNRASKGDLIDVGSSTRDWGSATVAPKWVRLTITDIPGDFETAMSRAKSLLAGWEKSFSYTKVNVDVPANTTRLRVQADEMIRDDLSTANLISVRDSIIASIENDLGVTVTVSSQSASEAFAELDIPGTYDAEIELEILANIQSEVRKLEFRRYYFPASVIDAALSGVAEGEVAAVSRTWAQVNPNGSNSMKMIDRLAE